MEVVVLLSLVFISAENCSQLYAHRLEFCRNVCKGTFSPDYVATNQKLEAIPSFTEKQSVKCNFPSNDNHI